MSTLRTMPRMLAVAACAVLAAGSAGAASNDDWTHLQAPTFGLLSQLGEEATRNRAVEFNQFVESLGALYTIDETQLPPLTIVLFARERDFAPYRNQTSSGQSENVSGFFGNAEEWSVIGMYGRSTSEGTRRTIYHEATHWLLSTNQVESPLWFKEGLAEVFSTFNVKNGVAEWGLPLAQHINYLNTIGLQPMEDFLRATQDEALHELDTYYPQAWAFVHFLLYGDNGERRAQLQDFLDQLRRTPLDTAFRNAFGMSYDDMTVALGRYLRQEKYVYQQVPLPEDSTATEELADLRPASTGSVEFALARLAVAGGNEQSALVHAQNVIAQMPDRPEGYEILAHIAAQLEDEALLTDAVDKAIARDTSDPRIYTLKGGTLFNASLRPSMFPDEALPPDAARQTADYYARALQLRPDNKIAMNGLVQALLSARTVADTDAALLDQLAAIFPSDGTPLFGKAILAHIGKDPKTANTLLSQAHMEPRQLPLALRQIARAVQQKWYVEWLNATVEPMVMGLRFAEARTLLDTETADPALTENQRELVTKFRADLAGFEAIAAVQELLEAGKVEDAKTQLRALVTDTANSNNIRSTARRILNVLNR